MKTDVASQTTVSPTLREYQGNCGTLISPAGNQFFNNTNTGDERLFTDDVTSGAQVVQYNNNRDGTAFDPDHPSTGTGAKYVNNDCAYPSPSYNSVCPTIDYDYGSGTKGQIKARLVELETELADYDENDEEYWTIYSEHWYLVSDLARNHGALEDPDSAATLLENYGRYHEAFSYYLQNGMLEDAQRVLDLMPENDEEEEKLLVLANLTYTMVDEDRDWSELDDAERDDLVEIAGPNSVPGSLAAAALDHIGGSAFIWPRPDETGERPANSNSFSNLGGKQGALAKKSDATLRFYPNPTTGRVNIQSTEHGTLCLSSIQGAQICTFDIKAGGNEIMLPNTLTPGIYFATFKGSGTTNHTVYKIVYKQ